MDHSRTDVGRPWVFRFKGMRVLCALLTAVVGLWLALSFIWIEREGFWSGVVFLTVGLLLFGVLGIMTLLGVSDIIIDNDGISRRLFGVEWQAVRWDCVQRIRIFRIPNFARGGTFRAFKIYSFDSPSGTRRPKTISFNEQSTDVDSLLRMINKFVAIHGIKVEVDDHGTTRSVDYV